jgi:hypothetical protein
MEMDIQSVARNLLWLIKARSSLRPNAARVLTSACHEKANKPEECTNTVRKSALGNQICIVRLILAFFSQDIC